MRHINEMIKDMNQRRGTAGETQGAAPDPATSDGEHAAPGGPAQKPGEIGGPKGPEPTRYGDWETQGRCTDF